MFLGVVEGMQGSDQVDVHQVAGVGLGFLHRGGEGRRLNDALDRADAVRRPLAFVGHVQLYVGRLLGGGVGAGGEVAGRHDVGRCHL